MTDFNRVERRKHARVLTKGAIILVAGDLRQHGRVANVGVGGVLALTNVTTPERLLGRVVELELRLDDGQGQWWKLSSTVTRIGADSLALSFVAVPPLFVRLIDDMTTASHADQRRLSVVLIDATSQRRAAIAEGFRSVGCQVIDVSTPLEAIVRLGEARFEPDLIAIADSLPGQISEDLRRFVEREHPRAKLVTIGDEVDDPTGLVHWLSSRNPNSDLLARVRQVLSRPTKK